MWWSRGRRGGNQTQFFNTIRMKVVTFPNTGDFKQSKYTNVSCKAQRCNYTNAVNLMQGTYSGPDCTDTLSSCLTFLWWPAVLPFVIPCKKKKKKRAEDTIIVFIPPCGNVQWIQERQGWTGCDTFIHYHFNIATMHNQPQYSEPELRKQISGKPKEYFF